MAIEAQGYTRVWYMYTRSVPAVANQSANVALSVATRHIADEMLTSISRSRQIDHQTEGKKP